MFCLCSLWITSEGYGSGAPQKACSDMTPRHGREQRSATPYRIELPDNDRDYSQGNQIRGECYLKCYIMWRICTAV